MADTVQASKPEEEEQEEGSGDDDENDEDDDSPGEEAEIYIVEAVLDHHADFLDGKVRYQVKWKGYEEESETTWEPEESFVGARGILEGYWRKVGGKPKSTAKPSAKKRGRQSAGQSSTPNGGRAKKQRNSGNHRSDEVDASTKKKKGATSNHDNDLNSPNPDEYTDVLGLDEWMPPRAFDGAWEESVQTVETVEADNDGVLWVFLSWNEKNEDGRFLRNKVKASTCYRACPQKMLEFFEKHLVLPDDVVSPARNP